ncbi:hypothetical protein VITU102760_16815 [Vibrio tubiashii]
MVIGFTLMSEHMMNLIRNCEDGITLSMDG